ncbi:MULTISPECIES: 2-oxoacid:acceptor oxidoreductase family protein [Metallosphaera]|uniref:2-oxoacid:acceptor oxidoreductase family protein n=1 Tax=Metallosphaera TaxID=41980 RepID=UPI001F063C79|nr:2-oxoacid:acceptor oxidoreductase family protein [Metallosphaera sedula]MCH1772029.1 2-oxoacid:acceptor oxidoreductase family protein [Metallosphaera sedula]MCP6729841.1 2-oxoacid:acceptor oxidoreductase family protein [Metallosphaera sedula]BBL46512.1 pyruvate:ferredoxin oxidoreductase, gamma subunit [Metallosphaera sedula]
MIEISLKGRGGQGVVTAGELLTKAVIAEGKYAQSIPFFGGERRGAPVSSEVRVSDKPIPLHRRVYNPDVVTVFDTTLLEILNPLEGIKENGVLIINSDNPKKYWKNTYYVNATEIARGLGLVVAGWSVVNTAMLGALVKVTGITDPELLEEAVMEEFPGKIGELNAKAILLGSREVRALD